MRPTQGLAYGLLGLPLAFVALPLYVLLPNHYARRIWHAAGHAGRPAAGRAACWTPPPTRYWAAWSDYGCSAARPVPCWRWVRCSATCCWRWG